MRPVDVLAYFIGGQWRVVFVTKDARAWLRLYDSVSIHSLSPTMTIGDYLVLKEDLSYSDLRLVEDNGVIN